MCDQDNEQEQHLKSWLTGQLTKTKQNEQSWTDLASSIAELASNHIESFITRLRSRNSLYDMNKEDLEQDSIELRKVFPLGDVSDEDLPHVIMQRRDEIHFKRNVYPLVSTLAREFSGMEVSWEKLYAPIDQEKYPYGTLFALESELSDFYDLTPEDFFLTSRGVIRIPINKIQSGPDGIGNDEIDAFEEKVKRVIYPLIPLRIACDGQTYYIKYELSELVEWVTYSDAVTDHLKTEEKPISIEPAPMKVTQKMETTDEKKVDAVYGTPRMDAVPMDAIALDRVYY
ncbi:hypothetical protein [Vibrio marisflavi]|uniref:Uncharacterized protein n=1 Tax=Vibrio marisflavi CECT 7928 TaxID=634439 RepID=A0ABM9A9B8_9VIBR|nr:hypothetical protein [Vibrio marisflavi]CAH0543062.1 hypothetical protein VMF7928_04383 [Vibrio marisflavi CECT 7928]